MDSHGYTIASTTWIAKATQKEENLCLILSLILLQVFFLLLLSLYLLLLLLLIKEATP